MAWSSGSLFELASAYWSSAALLAAVDLGVFDAIDENPFEAADLSARLGAPTAHLAALLDALCGLRVMQKSAGRYQLHPDLRPLLLRSGGECLLDALRFNCDLYPLWGRLSAVIRSGEPAVPAAAHLGQDPQRMRRFVMGMHSRALSMAPPVVAMIDLSGRRRLLDLGAGPGTFSRLLLDKYPSLTATLLDLPPVLGVAREIIAASPVGGRVAFHAGSYRVGPLPPGHDAVLYCGALHQESIESARALFASVHAALEPGGQIVVVDMLLSPDRTAPVFSTLFALNMLLTTPTARVFSHDEATRLLREAGFSNIDLRHVPQSPYSIVVGLKP